MQQEIKTPTTIYCDNMSTIAEKKNLVLHNRMQHIELQHHFIRELVDKREISMHFCKTDVQVADIFTKAISMEKFIFFRDLLRVKDFTSSKSSVQYQSGKINL